MNGEQDDPDAELFEDPLGLIPPPPPIAEGVPRVDYCDECGGIGGHLDSCPITNSVAWTRRHEKREKLLAAADASLPQLLVMATRRVGARFLRRIARALEP